jgi:hypothetical protein
MGVFLSPRLPSRYWDRMSSQACGAAILSYGVGRITSSFANDYLLADFYSSIIVGGMILFCLMFCLMRAADFRGSIVFPLALTYVLLYISGLWVNNATDTNERLMAVLSLMAALLLFIRLYSEGPEPRGWTDWT